MIAIAVLAALALPAAAQQHQPYSGQETRDIKALSAEEVKQYLAGAGMGYAKAAELNRFPGPQHTLELADRLGLSAEQRTAVKALMDAHKAEARAIGAKLVDSERALDALFRSGSVSESALADAVRKAAALQGEYRLSHLETHRRLRALLTEEQVARYDVLRGYTSAGGHSKHKH
jgi:Spy/CpxP family protein refolding chaperone